MWKIYLEKMNKEIKEMLYSKLGHGKYGEYLYEHFKQGYNYINTIADVVATWEFKKEFDIKDIRQRRQEIISKQISFTSLKPTEVDFPFDLMIHKTNHIPPTLKDYVENIQISSIFKSIHLEYLADKKISSIDDIKELVKNV